MGMRQTVSVLELIEAANNILSANYDNMHALDGLSAEQAYRMGAAIMLETALHKSGNYNGYSYQKGIVTHTDDGKPPAISDDSRRIYHKSILMSEMALRKEKRGE